MPDSRLRMLVHYKVLHVGVCFILTIALVLASAITGIDHFILRFGVVCFMLAGACGVVIVSNLVLHRGVDEFYSKQIRFLGADLMSAEQWLMIEQVFFWAGLLPIVIGFLFWGPELFRR